MSDFEITDLENYFSDTWRDFTYKERARGDCWELFEELLAEARAI